MDYITNTKKVNDGLSGQADNTLNWVLFVNHKRIRAYASFKSLIADLADFTGSIVILKHNLTTNVCQRSAFTKGALQYG